MSPKNESLVSIIMAIRDDEPFLEACIDSILNQTYTNWELLAVVTGNHTLSAKKLDRYTTIDNRIIKVVSREHSLNLKLIAGYKRAKGSMINRMDSDDRMPKNKLQVLVGSLENKPLGFMVVGGIQHFSEQEQVGEGYKRYDRWLNEVISNQKFESQLYKECVIPSNTWLMYRSDFDKVGGFSTDIYPEDYDLTFRIISHKISIIGIPFVAHFWREHPNRISRTVIAYRDNRYFDLKTKWFKCLHYKEGELVVWGAGKNGKDLAKALIAGKMSFQWVCQNKNKIGHLIYDIIIRDVDWLLCQQQNKTVLIAIANPKEQLEVIDILISHGIRYFQFL